MGKGYVIASNEKQLDRNIDYIIKRNSAQMQEKVVKRMWATVIWIWKYYTGEFQYYSSSNQLYKLLVDEIELYYLNNFIDKKEIQIKSAFNVKRQEKRLGIMLPIVLSIIASAIYTFLSTFFEKKLMLDVIYPFIKACRNFFEALFNNPVSGDDFIIVCKCVIYLLILTVLICLMILIPIIVCGFAIKGFVFLLGEINFEKNVVKEYEINFMERLLDGDNYHIYSEVNEVLHKFEESFFDCIGVLTYNYVIKNNKYASVVVLEQEVQNALFNNPILEKFDKYSSMWDKRMLIKALIYRAYRNINNRSKKLMLMEDKIYIRTVEYEKK